MKKLSDCRILIVDDAKLNIDILVEALKHDYKLSVALSGDTAIVGASKQTRQRSGQSGRCLRVCANSQDLGATD